MKKLFLLPIFIFALLFTACKSEKLPDGWHKAEVKEKLAASSYFYLLVKENGDEYWIAIAQMPIEIGDNIYYSKSLKMENFESPELKRTFPYVLFVSDPSKEAPKPKEEATNDSKGKNMPNPHANVASAKRDDIKITPVAGGKTVEQIYSNKENLNGKSVKIRGIVTKINEGILEHNWIHIQDGTGSSNEFDLLITTKATAKVGDKIIAEGTVVKDKNFGAGYSYEVLIEDATIKVE